MDDVVGKGSAELDKTVLRRVFGHFPAGTSLKLFSHVAQLINSNRFGQFDYGSAGNREMYGMTIPPDYDLDNVKVPIYLYYGTQDGIVSVTDMNQLISRVSSIKEVNGVVGYNHLEFLYNYKTFICCP